MLKRVYNKYKQIIIYLFFGLCTTIINTIFYGLLYEGLMLSNIVSTIAAWLAAVIFAFVTNKVYVFKSHREKTSERLGEIMSFFGCRIITGILDVAIMAVAVDILKCNGPAWKLISNIIVTVINYAASKFLIFKNRTK